MSKKVVKKNTPWTTKMLLGLGIPMVLIPGLLFAYNHGWRPDITRILKPEIRFPSEGRAETVEDGDTFLLKSGERVRLIGVNAPDRGNKGYSEASTHLSTLLSGKKIYLEYDRYQDDKYGRILAWIWTDCESTPVFLPPDYMHISKNESRPGLMTNPDGCLEGTLVNEAMVHDGYAEPVSYQGRGALKYEERIGTGKEKKIF